MEEEEFTLNDFMSKNKHLNKDGNVAQKKQNKQKKQQQVQLQQLLVQQLTEQNQQVCEQFSESLERFLKRAFLKCNSKNERKEMRKLILQEIKNAKLLGDLQERDWDNKDLPLLSREMIEKKLFNDVNAVTKPANHTEQQIKIIDTIVKKIKEDIINNTLVNQDNENSNQNNIQTQSSNIFQEDGQQQLLLNLGINQQNGKNNINQISYSNLIENNEMDVEQQQDNYHFDEDDFDVERMKVPIVGTSTQLEKEYLRLTGYPKPHDVRSPETLVKSFDFLMKKYAKKSDDYHYFQSQLRSIRQDLLIQNIKNEFTMKVLEENARICLENYDIQEYSRCLGQLIWMYRELPNLTKTNYKEFIYYRLIQNIFEDKKDNLLTCLQEINQDELLLSKEFEAAMKFQHAISMGNVKGFFNLYNNTQDHGKYLMDLFIKKWKVWGVRIISKTYGPQSISVSHFQGIFGFHSLEKAIEELKALNCVFDENNEKILVKDTIALLDQLRH